MVCESARMLFRPGGVDPLGLLMMMQRHHVDPEESAEIIDKALAFTDELIAAEKDEK